MAHVLFVDLVGYSRHAIDVQRALLDRLQRAIRASPEFRRAVEGGKLISRPTGDGAALVFFTGPEAPARCAIELTHAIRGERDLRVRMGIHSGPVYRVVDLNSEANVAGDGVNLAQRVMDCGDAGHILLSETSAGMLCRLTSWRERLHDLGSVEVKHGLPLRLFNLQDDDLGNPQRPASMCGGPLTPKETHPAPDPHQDPRPRVPQEPAVGLLRGGASLRELLSAGPAFRLAATFLGAGYCVALAFSTFLFGAFAQAMATNPGMQGGWPWLMGTCTVVLWTLGLWHVICAMRPRLRRRLDTQVLDWLLARLGTGARNYMDGQILEAVSPLSGAPETVTRLVDRALAAYAGIAGAAAGLDLPGFGPLLKQSAAQARAQLLVLIEHAQAAVGVGTALERVPEADRGSGHHALAAYRYGVQCARISAAVRLFEQAEEGLSRASLAAMPTQLEAGPPTVGEPLRELAERFEALAEVLSSLDEEGPIQPGLNGRSDDLAVAQVKLR
jgi:class 3 adenylate cyclase